MQNVTAIVAAGPMEGTPLIRGRPTERWGVRHSGPAVKRRRNDERSI